MASRALRRRPARVRWRAALSDLPRAVHGAAQPAMRARMCVPVRIVFMRVGWGVKSVLVTAVILLLALWKARRMPALCRSCHSSLMACHTQLYRISCCMLCPAVCSSCIRRTVEFQERQGRAACPSCRQPVDAADLRSLPALKVTHHPPLLRLCFLASARLPTNKPGLTYRLPAYVSPFQLDAVLNLPVLVSAGHRRRVSCCARIPH